MGTAFLLLNMDRSNKAAKRGDEHLQVRMVGYFATFYTHSGAVQYQRYLRSLGIRAELLPVPRRLSSDCGIGARFRTHHDLNRLINRDVRRLFLVDRFGERLVYSSGR